MKNLRITVNGTAYDVQVEELGESAAPAAAAPASAPAKKAAPAAKPAAPSGAKGGIEIKAPMPGTVAMKMETPVKAPQDGTVVSVEVAKGEAVDSGKVLVTLN